MHQTVGSRPGIAPATLGLVLIVVGVAAVIVRELNINVFASIGDWGWPFFVIVPGLLLLGAALVPAPPRGLGFAIAGTVVTTIGGLLLYQTQTNHWESWAYAWALIPMASGLGTFLYGVLTRTSTMITAGLWMAGIAAILFAVGAWFFEGIFAGDTRFADIGNWWPMAVIAVGAVILVGSFLRPRPTPTAPPADDSLGASGPPPL